MRLCESGRNDSSPCIAKDRSRLQLKSQEGSPGQTVDSNAVLCTPDKTYTLRQVSTSNEVYLAQASSTSDSFPPQGRLEAIAKCDSTLELQAAKNVSAIPHIKAALPTYATTGHYDAKSLLSKERLFANIPLSDAECAQAWQDLACFELAEANSQRAIIPSNGAKLKLWSVILESAIARGFDLTGSIDVKDVASIAEDLNDWPAELVAAVVRSMCSNSEAVGGYSQLEEIKCARVVGEMLLRERTENGRNATSLRSITEAWADMLPEKWRGRAEMSILENCYVLENGGEDVGFIEDSSVEGSGGSAATSAETKSTLGAKRKWHEKFRASKKTA